MTQGCCVWLWPRWRIAGEPSQGRGHGWRLKEKPPPLHGTWAVMKLSSPQHAQNLLYLPFFDEQGRFFFHAACESTFSCSAGAVFLSLRSLDVSCCERGSASARTLRHLGETDDIFAGGGWLGETDNAFVSGTCPVSAVCERSVGHWCQMVWMAGVVGLRDDVTSRRSARRPHWCGAPEGIEGRGCGAGEWRERWDSRKSCMQFDWTKIQQCLKKLQFQRCKFIL